MAIKYLGSGWKEESLDAIFDIFILDYNETQKQILIEDAKIWMMLTNWSTQFSNMMSKGQSKPFRIKSIKDYIGTPVTQKQRVKEKAAMKEFSKKSKFFVKAASLMYMKNKKK